jgi:hypothetical protein
LRPWQAEVVKEVVLGKKLFFRKENLCDEGEGFADRDLSSCTAVLEGKVVLIGERGTPVECMI